MGYLLGRAWARVVPNGIAQAAFGAPRASGGRQTGRDEEAGTGRSDFAMMSRGYECGLAKHRRPLPTNQARFERGNLMVRNLNHQVTENYAECVATQYAFAWGEDEDKARAWVAENYDEVRAAYENSVSVDACAESLR